MKLSKSPFNAKRIEEESTQKRILSDVSIMSVFKWLKGDNIRVSRQSVEAVEAIQKPMSDVQFKIKGCLAVAEVLKIRGAKVGSNNPGIVYRAKRRV